MATTVRLLYSLLFLSLLLPGATKTAVANEPLVAYTTGNSLRVMTAEGQHVLRIEYRIWGPGWAWTGIDGNYQLEEQSAVANFAGRIGRSNVPFTFHTRLTPNGKRQLKMEGEFKTEQDSELMLAGIGLVFDESLRGQELEIYDDATSTRRVNIPLGVGILGSVFQRIAVKDTEDNVYAITFAPPVPASHDGEIRLILAENSIRANDAKKFTLTLDLPEDTAFYLTADCVPFPDDWEYWFPWTATADMSQPSVFDASGLLEAPAGKHGRVMSDGDRLIYNGQPIKFWGVNICFEAIASPREISAQRAAFYARYGINAVRLHKFADGPDWDGILDRYSYVRYNPEKLARMDYFVARLKERGIYVKLSANFGRARVFRDDMERVPYILELGQPDGRGIVDPGGGALFVSTELQDIQIEQLINLLNHTNEYTGLTYAEDPVVMAVELVNEDSALFYNTMRAMNQSPTLKARMGREFAAWLKAKYETEEALFRAWGNNNSPPVEGAGGGLGATIPVPPQAGNDHPALSGTPPREGNVLNVFVNEQATGEAFNNGEGPIYPVGNPWFYDPDRLDGVFRDRRQRLVDTMLFWYDKQNEFYDRFVAAVRATGYEGEIIASNWQAGRGPSHFLNLHSDRRIGMIDRHNYFEGAGSMLAVPGSGLLSTGMQQVADRPFMFSEWIHTFPNEFGAEGPAIIGAYGMGLNDWDVSFMFQNSDQGRFRDRLGETWDVVAPQIFALFPAISRQVIRGDVRASEVVFARNVDFASLQRGEINFDDRIEQDYDVKSFSSDTTPVQALAVGRVVVDFVDEATETEVVDLSGHSVDGMFVSISTTRELAWVSSKDFRVGYILINTPRTQAVVGFMPGMGFANEALEIGASLDTPFAAIYVTSLDDLPLSVSKSMLITTIARARNTDQKMIGGTLIRRGNGPILMEPVVCELRFHNRNDTPTVYVLDHDGRRTGATLPVSPNNRVRLDGRVTRAVYYEVVWE